MYSPPVGNVTNFTATGRLYVVPSGDAVNFTPGEIDVNVAGVLGFTGQASFKHGTSLTVADWLRAGGAATLFTEPAVVCRDKVFISATASIVFPASLRALSDIQFTGRATLNAALGVDVDAAVSLSGLATLSLSNDLSAQASVLFGGAAQVLFVKVRTVDVSGAVTFGSATFVRSEAVVLVEGSKLFTGRASIRAGAVLARVSDKLRFTGGASFRVGRRLVATGRVRLGGAAAIYCGRHLTVSGAVKFVRRPWLR